MRRGGPMQPSYGVSPIATNPPAVYTILDTIRPKEMSA